MNTFSNHKHQFNSEWSSTKQKSLRRGKCKLISCTLPRGSSFQVEAEGEDPSRASQSPELKKQNLGSQRGKNLQSRAQRDENKPEKAFQRYQFFNWVLINTFV